MLLTHKQQKLCKIQSLFDVCHSVNSQPLDRKKHKKVSGKWGKNEFVKFSFHFVKK